MRIKFDKIRDRLVSINQKYRLLVLNDSTLEERHSTRLSIFDILVFVSAIVVFTTIFTLLVVKFTPVREYILGIEEVAIRKETIVLNERTDSLKTIMRANNAYLADLALVLKGELDSLKGERELLLPDETRDYKEINIDKISEQDSILREKVEKIEIYALDDQVDESNEELAEMYFLKPVEGLVTDKFDLDKEHFGIDIVGDMNAPVKAVLDGVVIFSSWTMDTGYVIAIQHPNDILSFYKHNSVLLKKVGNFVTSGDAIAFMGDSGENSTGPHLHFELWYKQKPVDPLNYINYN